MSKFRTLFRGLACIFMFLLIVTVLASWILETNRSMVDQTFGTNSVVFVTDENAGALFTAFTPDEEFLTDGKLDMDKNVAIHRDLSVRLQEEGSVLLKNQAYAASQPNALPLSQKEPENLNITVFGRRGYINQLSSYGGSGYTIEQALTNAGVRVNGTMKSIYDAWNGIAANNLVQPGWASNKTYDFKFDVRETSAEFMQQQNAGYRDSFSEYSDAAIVVLGRTNGEGADTNRVRRESFSPATRARWT